MKIGIWEYVRTTIEECPICKCEAIIYWSKSGGNAYQCKMFKSHNAGIWS